MKHLVAIGLLATVGSAQAVVLFNNGPIAAGGPPPISVIRTGGTLFGAGDQANLGNFVGDNFSVGGLGWTVESIRLYGYQTGAASSFTFTAATWSVISGDVNTGTVIASGTLAPVTSGGLQGYRVTSTTLTNTDRAIFAVDVNVPDFNLAPGNYWLRWGLTGSLASGPWQPPTSDGAVGNAVQALSNGAFNPVTDAGDGLGVEFPFTINGVAVVPEPGTWALFLAGGLAVGAMARRRRA